MAGTMRLFSIILHFYASFLLLSTAFGHDAGLSTISTGSLEVRLDETAAHDPGIDCQSYCYLGNSNKRKRSTTQATLDQQDWLEGFNATPSSNSSLSKRQWQKISNGRLVPAQGEWTIAEVGSYLYEQAWNRGQLIDTQYGETLLALTRRNEQAFSRARVFGNQPFQIGMQETLLTGCNLVTVITPKGVWMAHFWEAYTMGFPPVDGIPKNQRGDISFKAFKERMVCYLTNTKVLLSQASEGVYASAYPPGKGTFHHPYLEPTDGDGPLSKEADYLKDVNSEDIFVHIASPFNMPRQGPTNQLRYKDRVGYVKEALIQYLGERTTIIVQGYQKLAESEPTAADPRGLHLFQYDPNSDGAGKKQWRLFSEVTVGTGDVP